MPIETGAPAPDFTLAATGGASSVTLSALKGKKVVVYFYPKDDTPGCTVEATEFTALKKEFEAANTVVIGVSKDTIASHDKFCAKHSLDVILASDPDGKMMEEYGAWGLKKQYGREFMGVIRSTVLIDANGNVAKHWKSVKTAGHAGHVLKAALDI